MREAENACMSRLVRDYVQLEVLQCDVAHSAYMEADDPIALVERVPSLFHGATMRDGETGILLALSKEKSLR
jgi:hypothetical protein